MLRNNIRVCAVLVVAALESGPAVAIDIVSDPSHMAETIAGWGQQAKDMAAQVQEMQNQVRQLRDTYNSLTSARNLGAILDNPALRNYLPAQWQGVYDAVRRGGYEGLSGRAAGIYQNTKVFDGCGHLTLMDERQACEAAAVKPAQDKALAMEAYEQAANRINQLTQLMQRVGQTTDLKELGEIQGRIAVEQAMIQNEQTKMQLYGMIAQAEEQLQRQQAHERSMADAAKRGSLDIQPMQFSTR